jgi:hypothetical protein
MSFPNLPGIPPLGGFNASSIATVASPLTSNLLDKLKPAWGVYSDTAGNKKALNPDSFISISYHNEAQLPTFPVEDGAFSTYNKVFTPYDITLRVTKSNVLGFVAGGSDKMSDFLKTIDAMVMDTNLYTVITPDATYLNANLKGFDYKRELNNGAGIIIADLHFNEIMRAQITKSVAKATSVPPGSSVGSPSAQAFKQGGAVAPAGTGTFSWLIGSH